MKVGHVVKRLVRGVAVGMVRRWITSLLVLVMVGGTVYGLASQGFINLPGVSPAASSGAAAATGEVREMVVEEIRSSNSQQAQMVLILREKAGNRRLTMNVGPSEALAVAADMNGGVPRERMSVPPPTSYDLMRTLVKELGASVNRVVVTSLTNDTYYAKVIMNTDSRQVEVESRPSDAIALALRARVPIFAATSVLDQAGRSRP
ncbi:MAG: bifunctional nuclease family protein [Chloroflexi bacterium]|nr:bifunctional nuclease family protein [Chloroflexota bacterium]